VDLLSKVPTLSAEGISNFKTMLAGISWAGRTSPSAEELINKLQDYVGDTTDIVHKQAGFNVIGGVPADDFDAKRNELIKSLEGRLSEYYIGLAKRDLLQAMVQTASDDLAPTLLEFAKLGRGQLQRKSHFSRSC
jgi:hypothetical protein